MVNKDLSLSRTAVTYRYEKWRSAAAGVLETASTTFLLLIAVKYFHAGALAKGLVASGGSLGLMLGPVAVTGVARFGWSSSRAAALMAAVGAGVLLVMAALPFLPVFVVGSMLGMTATSAAIPLLTQMYHENYPDHARGKIFSKTVMIRIAVAAVFSQVAGQAFSGRIEKFQALLLIFAAAFGVASFALARIPTRTLLSEEGTHPFRALRFAYADRIFRQTLIAWMLMGFANLMMIPMRVEMLANPKYGLSLTVVEIAFLTGSGAECGADHVKSAVGMAVRSREFFCAAGGAELRVRDWHSHVFYEQRYDGIGGGRDCVRDFECGRGYRVELVGDEVRAGKSRGGLYVGAHVFHRRARVAGTDHGVPIGEDAGVDDAGLGGGGIDFCVVRPVVAGD